METANENKVQYGPQVGDQVYYEGHFWRVVYLQNTNLPWVGIKRGRWFWYREKMVHAADLW